MGGAQVAGATGYHKDFTRRYEMFGVNRLLWRAVVCSLLVLSVSLAACAPQTQPAAAKEVKVALMYPYSGASARVGQSAKWAYETAVEVINDAHPELDPIPLAKTGGLPNLGGAKIVFVYGDTQSSPEVGYSETQRMISVEKPAVVMGCDASSVTKTASQAAERAGVPFVNADSTSPALNQRGLNWFFRTTPDDSLFAEDGFKFLKQLKEQKGAKVETVALMFEDSEAGTQLTTLGRTLAPQYGFTIVEDITFHSGTTDLSSEVLRLKEANPDALITMGYDPDVILFVRTLKEQQYVPPIVIGHRGGWSLPAVAEQLGTDFENMCSTGVFAADMLETRPLLAKVNEMFKAKSGYDLDADTSRIVVGFLVVAEAINRAGSTDPTAIRDALIATSFTAEQTLIPWEGVKFDPVTLQNTLGRGILTQVIGGQFTTVWPFDAASKEFVYPIPPWSQR
jgi:branched-chain amino acid transport system substrate-binding protein